MIIVWQDDDWERQYEEEDAARRETYERMEDELQMYKMRAEDESADPKARKEGRKLYEAYKRKVQDVKEEL